MVRLIAIVLMMMVAAVRAADMVFILDDGDGTVSVVRDRSWNTPEDMPDQLAKFAATNAPALPDGVDKQWYAWSAATSNIVEASQDVKDEVLAQETARLQAIAVEDATTYSDAFAAVAILTTVVTNISAGVDSMPVIQRKALVAFDAAMQAGDTTTALTINGYATAAANAYQGVLKPAGIVGERFWRAMAAWSAALKAETDD